MLKQFSGIPGVIMLLVSMVWISCVPVEEKKIIPLDTGFTNSAIRQVYDLQNAHSIDSLILLLSSDDPTSRFAAARAFASIRDTAALNELIPLLTDPEGLIRRMAAMAIGQTGSGTTEAALTAAFDGRDSARMYESANSLILESMGKIGSTQFLKALSTISTYQPIDTLLLLGQVRGIYRYAMRDMTDPDGTATMVTYLSNQAIPLSVRTIAAHYLQRAKGVDLSGYSDQLVAIWHGESHPHLRMCIASALGKVNSPEALKVLTEAMATESDYRVKCSILRALSSYDYKDVATTMISNTTLDHAQVSEIAAQYLVDHGRESDVHRYRSAMKDCKHWQARTRLAEAANKYTSNMFSSAKTGLQNEILTAMRTTADPYQKAGWLKAYGSELRNFESIPNYFKNDQPLPVRIQAVTSLIDACRDKNFDTYFPGEGYLIKAQISGYLANALKSGDAGIIALIASAINDPKTGLKESLKDRKSDLNKALAGLKLPDEMETYLEVSKALKGYGIETAAIPDEQKKYKSIDWKIIDEVGPANAVTLSTTKGDISMTLFPERAPASVSAIVQLIRQGYYNGKTFHRVVPNFVIQTGCPRGDGFGSLDFTLRSEVAETYYDDEGYVGIASAGPDTEGPQFFITHSPTPHLDGHYTIIGKVTAGMDIVHRIEIGDKIKQISIR